MLKGGNARLRLFMENFGIGKELGLNKKYDCRALEYYRLLLRAEIDGRDVPMKKPSRAEALEPYFAKKLKDESDESVGILGSVTCLISSATSKIVDTAEGVYHKSLDLTSSIWSSLPEINKIPSATLDIFHSAADLMSSIALTEPSKAPGEAFEMKEFYKETEAEFFSGLDLAKSLNFSTETDIAKT
jgi:hypothetical protein